MLTTTSVSPPSIWGKSFAGRVAKVNLLRPLFIVDRSPSALTETSAPSGSARQMSASFRAGIVISPGCSTSTFVCATISTSRSVPVSATPFSSALISRFASTGRVCRRSTTPVASCNALSNRSLAIVNFIPTSNLPTIASNFYNPLQRQLLCRATLRSCGMRAAP